MKPKTCACGCGELVAPSAFHESGYSMYRSGHAARVSPAYKASRERATLKPPPGAIPSGVCECGCGKATKIAKQSRPKSGQYKGHPMRYIHGHNTRGKRAHGWKGGRKQNRKGYWLVWMPEHHLANKAGYVPEHRLVWEQTHGGRLNPGLHVHHINGDPSDNAPENLVALTRLQHLRFHGTSRVTCKRKSDAQKRRYEDPAERAKTSEATRLAWRDGKMANRKKPSH